MSEPKMNCGWEYPEWEFETRPEWVVAKKTPDMCKACEFFQACFMQRSSRILGMPMGLWKEEMIQMVQMQRMLQWEISDEFWYTIDEVVAMQEAVLHQKH